ncbi:MAG: O-methyltransferase [Sandaracinaceae bacterium]|nr:O-methyltransferase [Sandaracinaceae bacterium]
MADADSRTGLRYGTPEVTSFVDHLHAAHDPALDAAFRAAADHGFPAIQLAPSEGRLVEMLASMIQARRVVEIGTLTGYSAIRLARGLAPGGLLWTIERDPAHAAVAKRRIADAGFADRVEVLEGDAMLELPPLAELGPFDLVFLDADKGRYDQYGRWAHANLREGGVLLADNAYFFGRLLEDDPDADAMRRFHEEAAERFRTVCIPTPDGLLLGVKRGASAAVQSPP